MIDQIKNRSYIIVLLGAVFICLFLCSCSALKVEKYYENGVVATASPIATEIGIEVLKNGGNAFDVAVVVGFTLAVVHPEAGNIGGGGFALLRDGATKKVTSLDFRETAPLAAFETMYLDADSNVIANLSTVGAKAVGVPGTVAGLYELWEEKGSMEWNDLVTIAANIADSGFVVDAYLESSLRDKRAELSQFQTSAEIFYPNNQTVQENNLFVQSKLAKALYLIAAEGKDGFYDGEVADSIVATMAEYNGLITKEDLLNYVPVWREPIHIKFDSLDIYSMAPPSSGGIVIGQILKILEPYDFSMYNPNSSKYINLFAEASKLAFADRSKHLGDPSFYNVPITRLLDKDYLNSRREQIEFKHANDADAILPGGMLNESDQTTHYSIADKDGNLVSITYTLNSAYGSKLVANGFGFLLNNEMDDFSVKPGEQNLYGLIGGKANKIEPNKRMLSSMSPTIILKDNEPLLILGAPGGSKIITVVAQAILSITRFGMNVQETASQGRFHHQWIPDILYLEKDKFSQEIQTELESYGYEIKERSHYSDIQIIYIEPSRFKAGASDPRGRGATSGY